MSGKTYSLRQFVDSYADAVDVANDWQRRGAFGIVIGPPANGVMRWSVSARMSVKLPAIKLVQYTATSEAT